MFREPIEELQGKEEEEKKVGGEKTEVERKLSNLINLGSFDTLSEFVKSIYSEYLPKSEYFAYLKRPDLEKSAKTFSKVFNL